MYIGFFGIAIWVAKLVIGIGLIYNCLDGLLRREGMYDRESTNMMVLSQWLGIFLGVFLLCDAIGLVDLPIPYF